MKTITVLDKEYKVADWWNWVTVDEDGSIDVFYHKPTFKYWLGYSVGRYWESIELYNWKQISSEFCSFATLYTPTIQYIGD